MRSTGELLYLLMVIGACTAFAVVLAWVQHTWRPAASKEDVDGQHALTRAAE